MGSYEIDENGRVTPIDPVEIPVVRPALPSERVRWFADCWYFSPGIDSTGGYRGCSFPMVGEGTGAELDAFAWFGSLDEAQREELARRVATLEQVRRQDAPPARKGAQ